MIMALLYAPDNFAQAQTIVCTSGWDTDCNAGNVGCSWARCWASKGSTRAQMAGPLADRMLISSADGGDAINDAVRVSARLCRPRTSLARHPARRAAQRGPSFIFLSQAACRASRSPTGSGTLGLANIPFEAGRALGLRFVGLGIEPSVAMTPTFASPEVTRMRTYELMATPLIYSGQKCERV